MARLGAIVRVRDLRCPPPLEEVWGQVVDELGDLVVGRIVGPSSLLVNEAAVRRLRSMIESLMAEDEQEDWAPHPDAWRQGAGDERSFGPDPDAWKK